MIIRIYSHLCYWFLRCVPHHKRARYVLYTLPIARLIRRCST